MQQDMSKLPQWARELISLQVSEIDALKLQVSALEGSIKDSPVSRVHGIDENPMPDDLYRFRVSNHGWIDVRIADLAIAAPTPNQNVLDINGSDYLHIIPIAANRIQVWPRDRYVD